MFGYGLKLSCFRGQITLRVPSKFLEPPFIFHVPVIKQQDERISLIRQSFTQYNPVLECCFSVIQDIRRQPNIRLIACRYKCSVNSKTSRYRPALEGLTVTSFVTVALSPPGSAALMTHRSLHPPFRNSDGSIPCWRHRWYRCVRCRPAIFAAFDMFPRVVRNTHTR